jgi:hypothetical protein
MARSHMLKLTLHAGWLLQLCEKSVSTRIIEKALGTFLRLGNLQRSAWTSNYLTQRDHIRWLRDRLSELTDDDEIAPVANLSPPFIVLIDHELKPKEENTCIYTDGSLMNEQSVYIIDNGTPHLSMSERLPLARSSRPS